MAEQFKDQGGVATMDPSPLLRWLTSRIMGRICSPPVIVTLPARFCHNFASNTI
jgi:hypothetical protein